MGNIGQADYSTANAYLDAFCPVIAIRYVSPSSETGQTLSINWPLWKDGGMGMGMGEGTERMMLESLGMVAMETASGIEAFYQGLSSAEYLSPCVEDSQVMVMSGNLRKLNVLLSQAGWTEDSVAQEIDDASERDKNHGEVELEEKAVTFFKRQLSKTLKLSSQKIRADEPFEKYGIDSVMALQFDQ